MTGVARIKVPHRLQAKPGLFVRALGKLHHDHRRSRATRREAWNAARNA